MTPTEDRIEHSSPYRYFAYDPDDCFQLFRTKEEAINFAQRAIQGYADDCGDGWDEENVTQVCWGEIKEIGTMCNKEPWPVDEDDEGEPPFDYSCEYKLKSPGETS